MAPKWKFLGALTFLVPVLIMTYYAVIGGWVTKYAVVYLTGQIAAAAQDNYFTSFITSPVSPVLFALLFMGVTAFIVYNGVEGGIERVSRYMMPILLVLVVVIAGYSLTLHHVDESGQVRRSKPDVYFPSKGICSYGKNRYFCRHPVLRNNYFCHSYILYFRAGIHHCQLHGDLPHRP